METINGVVNPVVGTVAVSDGSNINLTVTAIYRYNRTGFACGVTDNINFSGTMEVYWSPDNNRFQAREYVAERHRDKDGVEKGL